MPCGAPQKFLARQIALRPSAEKFDAPNCPAELWEKIRRAKFFCGGLKKFSARQIGPRRAEFFYGASNPAAERCAPGNREKRRVGSFRTGKKKGGAGQRAPLCQDRLLRRLRSRNRIGMPVRLCQRSFQERRSLRGGELVEPQGGQRGQHPGAVFQRVRWGVEAFQVQRC